MLIDRGALCIIAKCINDRIPSIRLMACTCLTNFYKTKAIGKQDIDMATTVVPSLIKLVSEEGAIKAKAPMILGKQEANLAYLIVDSDELQKAACDADAIAKLTPLVMADEVHPQYKEAGLLALAAVCSSREESRKQVIDSKILPHIISSMADGSSGVRAAACQCTRSLSRSVKNLRTCLIDAGISMPLFKLLSDESIDVQSAASATICNIVLDFCPMKKVKSEI